MLTVTDRVALLEGWIVPKMNRNPAAITTDWIVNLVDRRVEVHNDRTGPAAAPAYRRRHDFGPADQPPIVIDDRPVARMALENPFS